MSFIQSNGVLIVSALPTHTPSGNEAVLAFNPTAGLFYGFDGSLPWNTLGFSLADGDKGDLTVASAGTVWTVDSGVITLAKLANIATDRLIGRDTAGTGVPEALTVSGGIEFSGSGGIQSSAHTGDVTKAAGGTVNTIANDAVTYAKIQNVTANKVIGRGNTGTGDPVELDFTVAAQGLLDDASYSAMRTTLGVAVGVDVQPYDATLASLAIHNTDGLLTQTAADTFTGRTITGTANEVAVANGNGVGGNPTLSLATGINPTKLADGSVSATEFQYLNGVTSAIQTQLDAKVADADVVHDTGNETIAGVKTFSSDPLIPDEVYGVGWNGVLEPPTKNAVYDKIETIVAVIPSKVYKVVVAQVGTSAPTGTVVANTLGEVPTLGRTGVGLYDVGTVGTPFTAGKVIVHATLNLDATAFIVKAGWTANNKISFSTFTEAGVAADLVGSLQLSVEILP